MVWISNVTFDFKNEALGKGSFFCSSRCELRASKNIISTLDRHYRDRISIVQEQPITEAVVQEPIQEKKKRRGRKPKPTPTNDTDNPLGRPVLARNALEFDTPTEVVLRRSKRNK